MAKKNAAKAAQSPKGYFPAPVKSPFAPVSSHAAAALVILCLVFFSQVVLGLGNFWEDAVQLELPNRIFARNSFLHWEFPHWNPYSFNGMPFFATQLPGVLYPINILISFLPLGLGAFWYILQLLIVLHSAISGITMFFFLRHKKFGVGAAMFGSIAYMFCGFIVVHAVHPMMINIVAWLPLVLLFLEKAMLSGKIHSALIAGLILGATTLSGHPQVTFYEFLFIAVYSFAFFLGQDSKKYSILAMPVIIAVIGVCISMVQTLPSMEINSQAARADWAFQMASEGSISWRQLVIAVMPKFFGAWTGEPGNTVPAFWLDDSFHSGYYTYWETCFYSGIAVFVMAISYLIAQRKNKFYMILILWLVFSMTIAMGSHFFLYKILFDYVPGFNRFRSPGRILFTWNFVLPLLAAAAFDRLKSMDAKHVFFKLVIVGSSFCLALGLLAGMGFFQNMWPELALENRAGYAAKQGWMACLNALVVLVPVLLYVRSKLSLRTLRALLLSGIVIDLFTFGMGHHIVKEPVAQRSFGGNRDLIAGLHEQTADGKSRVSIRQFVLEPGKLIGNQTPVMIINKCQGMFDDIQCVEGYSPLNLRRKAPPALDSQFQMYLDLLNVSYYINPEYRRGGRDLIMQNPGLLPRARMFYRAKIFPDDSAVTRAMLSGRLDYRNELALTEKPDVALVESGSDPASAVRITHYGAHSIKLDVETPASGLLWMSEIWYPAWRAKVDGKKVRILCADNSFRTIAVPAGNHKVEFYYSSSYFNTGALIALMATLIPLLWLLFSSMINKRRDHLQRL